MLNHFVFFVTVEGNEPLLKEEVRLKYPSLKPSFQAKGLMTFKSEKPLSLEEVAKIDLTFYLRKGLFITKFKSIEEIDLTSIEEEFSLNIKNTCIHSFSLHPDFHEPTEIGAYKINEICKSKYLLNLMVLNKGEVWVGLTLMEREINPFVAGNPQIALPSEAPSRAYLKIAEAQSILDINFSKEDNITEYGSAPGGTTYYLLKKGMTVIGVDPALMSETCLSFKNFLHLKESLQNLSYEMLPKINFKWITVDLNLNPRQGIKEVLRLAKRDVKYLRGIFFTVKLVKTAQIANIEDFKDEFRKFGAVKVLSLQIPSHKQEYLIYSELE